MTSILLLRGLQNVELDVIHDKLFLQDGEYYFTFGYNLCIFT